MMRPVILPILEANMTHGVVRAWLKREGDSVDAGEALFEVETDKVNAEVEAEASGVLRHIVAAVGTRVPVLSVVAFIGAAEEAVPPPETWNTLLPSPERSDSSRIAPPSSPAGPVASRVAASPAARRLARERGIALEGITPTGARGEITRADVEAASVAAQEPGGDGRIDPSFLAQLHADVAVFRALSSDMKVRLYRQHGAQIGEHVRIEPGAIILAAEICIGVAATIGADSTIECDRFEIGRLSALGKRTRIHCRALEIGDALWSKDDVVIGGGGSGEAGACLRAGDACFFGEGAYLNTGHPLSLGDEVCIGSRAMLFTHSHWQSVLRGYPSLFGPIEIHDHVFVGNNAFVFPGVTINAGATVMVNSFVALNVPADTLVGGVPAQVIRHIVPPTREQQIAMLHERFMPELAAALGQCGYSVAPRRDDATHGTGGFTLALGDDVAVRLTPSWNTSATGPVLRRLVALSFADMPEPPLRPGMTLFDLQGSRVFGVQDELSDEVREFCRRRGIRFRPFAWRYRVGHWDGERFHPRRAGLGR